tara:strand:+ start:741 stop:1073 length:333 start_codon:yes stop_codon:yes gene_type:complete
MNEYLEIEINKKIPKSFNAKNPLNAKSRTCIHTNCTECSKQRKYFKKWSSKNNRVNIHKEINDKDPKYRNNEYKSKYQSYADLREADDESKKRFFKGRNFRLGRNVFEEK